MWNNLNKLRRFLRIGFFRTLFFNFYMLPFSQAIKMPIILTRNVRFYDLSGTIKLNKPIRTGMIRFGFFGEDSMYWNSVKTLLSIKGIMELENDIHFANGIVIRVETDSKLKIESNVRISNKVKIIAYQSVHIKKNCRIAWESQIIDTTFHYIRNTKTKSYSELNGPITIGENNWIGNRCSIMKSAITPNHTIIAAGSLVNKQLNIPEYSILAGSPVKLIKTGYYRVLDEEEKEVKNQ